MRLVVRTVILTVSVLVCAAWPAASNEATGAIGGAARGPDGARLPGVTLTLVHLESGHVWRTVAPLSGVFHLDGLPAGPYRLVAELDGFEAREIPDVRIEADRTANLDIVLELAMVREHVDVVGAGPRDAVELGAIRDAAAHDVSDAASGRPGVTRLRKGAIAGDIVLRGLQSKDLTVVIDGQRVQGACPNHMDPPSFHADLAEVQRVEISKGPFDVKHQGSLGGVVNVVTQRPAMGWRGLFNVALGSATYVNPSATASIGTASLSLLGGGSWRRGDAYRDGNDRLFTAGANYRPTAKDLPAFSAATGWARVAWVPRDGNTLQFSYTRQDSGEILYPYLQMDALNDDADRLGLRYETTDGPGAIGTLAAQLYFTRVRHWMTDEHRTTSATSPRGYSMGTDAQTRTWGGRVETTWHGISMGSEASWGEWNTTTAMAAMQYTPQQSLADAVRADIGVYAEGSHPVNSAAAIDLGARLDWVDAHVTDTGANTTLYQAYDGTSQTRVRDVLASGKARLTWQLPAGVTVAGGAGRSTRTPDQEERFLALRRMGTDLVGNPALAPATNTGLEGEFEIVRRGARAGVSVFSWWIDDFIVVQPVTRLTAVPGVANTRARGFANVDAWMRGAEVSASLPLVPRLSLAATASFVRGTERADGSPSLAEIPPARASATLQYDGGRVGAAIECVATARQDDVDTSLNEQPTPGFTILNARLNSKYKRLSVSVGVINLLDRAYFEHLSYQRDPYRNGVRVFEPGRSVFLNAAVTF